MAIDGEDAYRQTVRELSDAIVEAQGPVRVLNAIKWDDQVREAFFASDAREQPPVDAGWYEHIDLGCDIDATSGSSTSSCRSTPRSAPPRHWPSSSSRPASSTG